MHHLCEDIFASISIDRIVLESIKFFWNNLLKIVGICLQGVKEIIIFYAIYALQLTFQPQCYASRACNTPLGKGKSSILGDQDWCPITS
jgi:hypothetical protein